MLGNNWKSSCLQAQILLKGKIKSEHELEEILVGENQMLLNYRINMNMFKSELTHLNHWFE